MRRLVFINSNKKINRIIRNLIQALKNKNYSICFVSSVDNVIKDLKISLCVTNKIFLGPSLNKKINQIIFLLLYLFLLIVWFFKILFSKKLKKRKVYILNNWNEKLIITPLKKIFSLKVIWLEDPEINYDNKLKVILFLFKFLSKQSRLIVFLEKDVVRLKKVGIEEEKIELIPPGIFLNQHVHQDSIFSSMAKTERETVIRKYFTVGIVTNFQNPNQIENLFQAVKKTLGVVPNIQLIIVGDGEERKKYQWITKKLEIDNLVWFVGQQKYMRKWLDGLDIFISVSEAIGLNNIEVVLKAMESKLPVVGFRNIGLEDLINEEYLLELNNSEVLADEIIKQFKDKKLRKKIGENNFEIGKNKFDINISLEKLEKLIKKYDKN
jgi:glycosyltransferase involved in cell wall biosynthesis